ncbi:MAG: patatin-like phospholipase family protein [Gammaproteobacteria bacterium]|nr:patatin-like phospholipase family protein [Gammaproteobacteria bacterium]MDH4254101.1 patatin-like phospholipase family protein [Gammaproteobacteria bacterium]MDH5309049.1 patatin-like phospholipase family protein [Gammaproteobacteria bacterium]
MTDNPGKNVSLVLGSGGARGLAHIGIIHWLEKHGYCVQSISGCSMGAVIGGIYAAGKLDEYERWVCAVDKMDIVSLLDFSWRRGGLVKGEKIIDLLRELVGDQNIENLPIRFTAVAADIKAEKEVWIQKGCLFDAMRASMSLPMFFTPFEYKGAMLIDGGVLNPVPIAPTFSDHTDLTIAVNLGGRVRPNIPKKVTIRERDANERSDLRDSINRFIERLQNTISRDGDDDVLGVYDIANQAFDAMQGTISRAKLAAYPPDKVVTIPRNACGILEFDRAREMIELGYESAREQLGNDDAGKDRV